MNTQTYPLTYHLSIHRLLPTSKPLSISYLLSIFYLFIVCLYFLAHLSLKHPCEGHIGSSSLLMRTGGWGMKQVSKATVSDPAWEQIRNSPQLHESANTGTSQAVWWHMLKMVTSPPLFSCQLSTPRLSLWRNLPFDVGNPIGLCEAQCSAAI